MTVIAWDGRALAADRLMQSGDTRQPTTKIWRHGGGLVGVTGNLSVGMEMLAWFRAGAEPAAFPASNRNLGEGATLVHVDAAGRCWRYDSTPHAFVVEGPFAAFGSGDMAALVAMHCGKTAREAVEVAAVYCSSVGLGVDELALTHAART